MDRSYPYTRRVARRTQLHKRIAALAVFGLVGSAVLYTVMAMESPLTPAPLAQAMAFAGLPVTAQPQQQAAADAPRRVYPYSIVPGGVADARELGRVIRQDRVVAAHYAEFALDKAHEKTVDQPRAVHVSYRKGDQVYWTAKKVMLAKGETLVSDGTHEARARCANRISDTPQFPVEAHGPTEEELDSSVLADNSEGGLQNVSAGLPGDEGFGPRGSFLHAPGSGNANATLSGGVSAAGSSLFAAADVSHIPPGAYLTWRSAAASDVAAGETGPADGTDGGAAPSNGGVPGAGAAETGATTPAQPGQQQNPQPTPQPAPQPAQPDTPAAPTPAPAPQQPGSGAGDGSSGGVPATPTVPSPVPPRPDTEQVGGGENVDPAPGTPGTPGAPPAGTGPQAPGGGNPPDPTLMPPVQELPGRDPAPPTQVPEPASIWLVAGALGLMLALRRRSARTR